MCVQVVPGHQFDTRTFLSRLAAVGDDRLGRQNLIECLADTPTTVEDAGRCRLASLCFNKE